LTSVTKKSNFVVETNYKKQFQVQIEMYREILKILTNQWNFASCTNSNFGFWMFYGQLLELCFNCSLNTLQSTHVSHITTLSRHPSVQSFKKQSHQQNFHFFNNTTISWNILMIFKNERKRTLESCHCSKNSWDLFGLLSVWNCQTLQLLHTLSQKHQYKILWVLPCQILQLLSLVPTNNPKSHFWESNK
jgi:hypothetical protein